MNYSLRMNKDIIPLCFNCGVKMGYGVALVNELSSGEPDFDGDKEGVTLHADMTQLKSIICWKCPSCGKSLSLPK
jgi:hypothetical protein